MKKGWFEDRKLIQRNMSFINHTPPYHQSIKHSRHPLSSMLWWKWAQRIHLTVQTHEMAITTQWTNQRIVKRQQNKIWTLYITHITMRACRPRQTKPRPKFRRVKKKRTHSGFGRWKWVSCQPSSTREGLKSERGRTEKIEDNDGRVRRCRRWQSDGHI